MKRFKKLSIYPEHTEVTTSAGAIPHHIVLLPELEILSFEGEIGEIDEWVASLKGTGIVVSAPTKEQAIDELMTSIRVQLMYEYELKNIKR